MRFVIGMTLGLLACKGAPTPSDTDPGEPPTPQSGELVWLKTLGGPADADWSHAAAMLDDGGIVVVGSLQGAGVAGDGEPNETQLSPVGGRDGWLAVFERDGSLRWARTIGSTGLDYPTRVVADGDRALVTGYAGGELDHGGTTLPAGQFVLGFEGTDGTPGLGLALATAPVPLSETGRHGLVALPDGSLVGTGSFSGTLTLDPGLATEVTLTSAGGSDLWLARWAPDGTLTEALRYGGAGDDYGFGLHRDGTGFVLSGAFDGALDLEGTQLTGDRVDGFIAWLDSDLVPTDVFTWGGPGAEVTLDAVPTPSGLVFHGYYDFEGAGAATTVGTETLAALGGADALVARLDGSHTVDGVWRVATSGPEGQGGMVLQEDGEVAVAAYLNLPVMGAATSTVDVPGYQGEVTGPGGALFRVPVSGDPTFTRFYQGGGLNAVVADPDGGLYIAGDFQTGFVCGEGEPGEQAPQSRADLFDAMLFHLAP